MKDLNEWWARLTDADRALFIEHSDTSPLPAHVVERVTASGQPIAGARWVESNDGYAFNWPSWVQRFLEEKARERAT